MMRPFLVLLLFVAPLALAAPREVEPPRRAEGRAVIVRSVNALTDAEQAELKAGGLTIKHALPGGRYLARMTDGAGVAGDARILSIEPLTAEKKLHPSAVRMVARGRSMADVNLVFHRDVTFDEAREAVLAAGGAMDVFAMKYLPSQRIEARVPASLLHALAEDDRVLTVAGRRRLKVTSDNSITAAVSHVTELYSAPYGLTGAGVALSLFELAEGQASHVEFGGRMTIASTTAGGTSGDRLHATHVAGTMAAAGVRAEAKGMAPNATVHEFCVLVRGVNNCRGDLLSLKEDALKPLGVVADNNSWGYIWGWQDGTPPLWNDGDVFWGAYDLELTAPLDEISIETNVLFVHSAGNDGLVLVGFDEWKSHLHVDPESPAGDPLPNQTFCVSKNGSGTDCPASCNGKPNGCELQIHNPSTPFNTHGTTASAKNVISVGAVDSSLNIYGLSSRGPTKDGRVKPDVVARGTNVFSSVPIDNYRSLNGTSMASPAVTGMVALLAEQWRRTFAGANATPAQLKALVIAGTEDLGNAGPDYTFGFGLVNAKKSVDLIRADGATGLHIHNFTFQEGQQQSFEKPLIVDATQTLRVVLNWPDPAIPYLGGDDYFAEKALVNDLDLRVIDPAGNVQRPYVLDVAAPATAATKGINTIDNIEMVEIPNATPGVYRVIATGTRLTEGPQDAVLVSTIRGPRPCRDTFEPFTTNTPEGAFGNIVSGALLAGGLCATGDVDYFKFVATKTGATAVTVTTGDTALRVTITGNGISRTQTIAAFTTATLNADVNTVPNTVTVKVEALGALGLEPQYTVSATYPEVRGPKRRSSRK